MRIALRDLSFETEHLCESSAQNEQSETVQASVAIISSVTQRGTRHSKTSVSGNRAFQRIRIDHQNFTRKWYVDFSLRNIFGLMITG